MKFRKEIGADTILEDWTPPEVSDHGRSLNNLMSDITTPCSSSSLPDLPLSSPHALLPLSSLLPILPPKVLKKCFPGGFFGEDREGNPVWYDAMGNIDFKGQTSKELDHMTVT